MKLPKASEKMISRKNQAGKGNFYTDLFYINYLKC